MDQSNKQVLLINDRFIGRTDPDLQNILGAVYGKQDRPRCMCVTGGIEMYVAKYGQFFLKCMPGTGSHHHPSCDAFEPDSDASGAGAASVDAVTETVAGVVDVRVRFPLTRQLGTRAAPVITEENKLKPDITAGRHALSLAAFLHLLFERAGLHRWHPAIAAKRSYADFHRCLVEAGAQIRTKGILLRDLLFVPEPYHPDHRGEIITRRRRRLGQVLSINQGRTSLMLIVGELKTIEQGTGNRRIMLKHMPDLPLLIEERVWNRVTQKFRNVLAAKDSGAELRVVLGAAVYVRSDRELHVETLSLSLTSKYWIPLAGSHELALHEALVQSGRRFFKPLRYDAKSWSEFANFLLLDAGSKPVALHLIDPWDEPETQATKERLAAGTNAWGWRLNEEMPPLPVFEPAPATSNVVTARQSERT